MRERGRELPETLRRIAEARGETAALRVAYFYGGRAIYLPRRRRLVAAHPLVRTLGQDLALALVELFGRGSLEVPFGPLRASSNRLRELPPGLRDASEAECARALGVHVRTIRRARHRARNEQLKAD